MDKDYSRIAHLLRCTACQTSLNLEEKRFLCVGCGKAYPIVGGIPRFVDEPFYTLSESSENIEEKTKNYFGFEWDYFNDWGFIKDEDVPEDSVSKCMGGRVSDRIGAFDSKCRLNTDDLKDRVVMDAGCGNGRYSYEAGRRATDGSIILGVDIGYGSVKSAFQNTIEQDNVFILQASLFDLPFKDGVIQSCFSNGVLMHTGDAHRAFIEVARVIKNGGVLVAHLYGKLNPIWEFNDRSIRAMTTRFSIDKNMILARILSAISRLVNRIPKGFRVANYLIRLQPSLHHMFDWYSAPVASHHTYRELAKWFEIEQFEVLEDYVEKIRAQEQAWLDKPWAINLKGRKSCGK